MNTSSSRTDGRGHWPKGKRRNQTGRQAKPLLRAARKDGLSWREIAILIGVDQRQVRRYTAGEDYPNLATMKRIVDTLECYLE